MKACVVAVALCSAVLVTRAADAEPFYITLSGPAEYNLGATITGFGGLLRAGIGGPQTGTVGIIEVIVDGSTVKTVQAEIDGEYRFTLPGFSDNGPHTVQAIAYRGNPFLETASTTLTLRAAARLAMTPTGIVDFGTTIAGGAPVDRTFTVTNNGGGTSGALQIETGGEFSTIGCSGSMLAPGASCTFTARLTPRVAASTLKVSALNVTGVPGGNVKATLRGSVTGLTLSPLSVSFADTAPGQVSQPRIVTLTNTASVTSAAINVTNSGDTTSFPITDDTCTGASLAPGGQCGFTIRFAPLTEGFKSALRSFSASPGGYPVLAISGTCLGARLDILPTGTEFGTVAPGSSKDKSMSAVNSGLLATGPVSLTLGGPDMAQFSIVANSCSGVSLAPDASCGFTIRFTPASSGVKTAHVTASASPGGTFNAWLKGSGGVV